MRRWLLLVPVVAAFVVGGIGLFSARPPADLGKPPVPFTLPDVTDPGRKIALTRLLGREPVVLNFWASWCEPCKDEAPEFRRTANAHPEVTFLGVNILDGRGPAGRFMKAAKLPYDSVSDVRGVMAKRYGVTGAPETFFIDRRGILVGRYIGGLQDGELESLVRQLVRLEPGRLLDIRGRGETRPVP